VKEPDILALTLEEALSYCTESGWDVEVVLTKAPGYSSEGRPRVLRFCQISPGKGVLTVARE
jgi:hypothetical protein